MKQYSRAVLDVDVRDNKLRAVGRHELTAPSASPVDAVPQLLLRLQTWTIPLPGAQLLPEFWDIWIGLDGLLDRTLAGPWFNGGMG